MVTSAIGFSLVTLKINKKTCFFSFFCVLSITNCSCSSCFPVWLLWIIPPLVFHSTSPDWFSLFLDTSTQLRTTALSYGEITCLFPIKARQSVRKREVLLLVGLSGNCVACFFCLAACLASAGGCYTSGADAKQHNKIYT